MRNATSQSAPHATAPRARASRPPVRALLLAAAILLAGACRSAAPSARGGAAAQAAIAAPTTARDLVQRMHQRWGGRWYRSLQFLQQNTFTTTGGAEQKSQWMQYQAVPGKLRIDFLPATDRSGTLFVDNVQRTYTRGRLTDTRPLVHGLLVLTADVYATPVDETMRLLDSLKVDVTKFYATRGVRQMYIVGAEPGDTASNQFWIDADSLLLRRLVQRSVRAGRTTLADTRITYQSIDGVPVPREITFLRNGAPYLREEYTQVKVNATIPPELFDPERWSTATRP